MQTLQRRTPSRLGRGFLLSVVVLTMVFGFAPARAETVTVGVQVDLGYPPAAVTKDACSVSVPAGATGLAVLDAAIAKGCVSSYDTVVFSGKHYVSCIDDVCQLGDGLATYWRMTVSDAYVCYGADDFRAANGKKLGFAYVPGASFVLDPAC